MKVLILLVGLAVLAFSLPIHRMKDKLKRTKLSNIDVDYKPKSRVGDVVRRIWNNQHSDDQNLDVEPLPSPYKVGVCPHFNICRADTFNEPLNP